MKTADAPRIVKKGKKPIESEDDLLDFLDKHA
jgi:hypothetical protein